MVTFTVKKHDFPWVKILQFFMYYKDTKRRRSGKIVTLGKKKAIGPKIK